jgi:hypothetical protein
MVNRAQPAGPARAYQTYAISAPKATHTKAARCADVGCSMLANGFRIPADEATDLGARQAAYLRAECLPAGLPASAAVRGLRRYVETHEAGLTVFTFPPGTECFAEHRVSLQRPELYIVRAGDWRGNPTGQVRRHTRPDLWVEDFATHQDRIATRRA